MSRVLMTKNFRFLTLSLAAASLAACGGGDSEGPATEASAMVNGYNYDFVPPASIQSSASSGGFQIAELDTSFPIQSSDISVWLAEEFDNNAVVRSHAWSIWGALTTLTNYEIENPNDTNIGSDYLPAYMTWYSSYEVYGVNSGANARCTASRAGTTDNNGILRCRDGSLLDFNKFSLIESQYVINSNYNNLSTLTARVNSGGGPLDLPPFESSGFQSNTVDNVSFSLKPVYYLLKNNAHNLLPYWGGMQAGTTSAPGKPTPNTWNQCVLVTIGTPTSQPPSVCNPGNGNANAPMPAGGWPSASLTSFMSLPLTQQILDELNYANTNSSIQGSSILSLHYTEGPAAVGDVAVLVGMHVTVRETKDWVWQTMYWSPTSLEGVTMNTGYPDFPPQTNSYQAGPNYPGSSFDNPWGAADNQPGNVPTWAGNYAMCTAYSTVYPVQPDDGGSNAGTFPQICYNPWLETAFDTLQGSFSNTGLNSNCMTCHGQASYNGAVQTPTTSCNLPQGFGYYSNGYIARNNSCLTNQNFDYDFSWHISNAWSGSSQTGANAGVVHQKPPIVAPSFSQ